MKIVTPLLPFHYFLDKQAVGKKEGLCICKSIPFTGEKDEIFREKGKGKKRLGKDHQLPLQNSKFEGKTVFMVYLTVTFEFPRHPPGFGSSATCLLISEFNRMN